MLQSRTQWLRLAAASRWSHRSIHTSSLGRGRGIGLMGGGRRGGVVILIRGFCSRAQRTVEALADGLGPEANPNASGANEILRPGDVPDFPVLTAVGVNRRPVIPGTIYPVVVTNRELIEHVQSLVNSILVNSVRVSYLEGSPYLGTFLRQSEVEVKETDKGTKNQKQDGIPAFDTIDRGIMSLDEIYTIGTLTQIHNIFPIRGGISLVLQGHRRLTAQSLVVSDGVSKVKVQHYRGKRSKKTGDGPDVLEAYANEILTTIKEILKFNPLFKEQLDYLIANVDVNLNPGRLADTASGLTGATSTELQEILEAFDIQERVNKALYLLKKELQASKLQREISQKVEEKVNENHRKFLLQEQLKNIKRELGLEKDGKNVLSTKFKQQLDGKDVPEEVMKTIEEELERLSSLEESSSEFSVTRNYLDWLTGLPWGLSSNENFDISRAQKILDRDHYGMEDVKNRILEFIAVGKLLGQVPQGKIVCLVGPPGVGKTSIGKSIAEALNREFFRFSVGGLSDVAEIKGHRRTYVGSMPGKLIQCLKKTQVSNPVVMIDEIDKMGTGYRGDPSSALLEVLDPSQNASFMDHYLDVPIDLSRVLFICTANMTDTIPGPLADRMEFIPLSGYIMQEKVEIAKQYLSPAALKETGLTDKDVQLSEASIEQLVRWYCREAGVRNLQKHINQIYRKAALHLVQASEQGDKSKDSKDVISQTYNYVSSLFSPDGAEKINSETSVPEVKVEEKEEDKEEKKLKRPIMVTEENLGDYVGKPIFTSDKLYDHTPVGVVMGLAFNQLGGATLYIEATVVDEHEDSSRSGLHTTGQLGDVMKESAQIAYTVAKRTLRSHDRKNNFFSKNSIHMHVPEGATPKDGPSAGITMVTALLSLATGKQVRKDLAMTGEITLTGRVLPIGGVREKTIAARRELATTLIFPKANEKDFEELPHLVKEGLKPHFVENFEQVYKIAFESED